jgi:hypothetical protein
MVALNVNPEQNGELEEWRAKSKYTFPIVLAASDDYARDKYGVEGTPTNLLLDGDGRMVFRVIGYGTGGEQLMETQIRELLGLDPFEGLEPAAEDPEKK